MKAGRDCVETGNVFGKVRLQFWRNPTDAAFEFPNRFPAAAQAAKYFDLVAVRLRIVS